MSNCLLQPDSLRKKQKPCGMNENHDSGNSVEGYPVEKIEEKQ